VLRLRRVSFRQAENTGAVDWPYSRGDRGPFACLVDATRFRRLIEARFCGVQRIALTLFNFPLALLHKDCVFLLVEVKG
jgi:hypothetical protein